MQGKGVTTSKHIPLSIEEIRARKISSIVTSRLESSNNTGLMKVLDWGCGRGALVGALLLKGYEAHGVEVDASVIGKAKEAYDSLELDSEVSLSLIEGNVVKKPSSYFDCIICEHVIEHVADFDSFLTEVGRLLKKGGFIFAVAPSKYCFFEQHLKMPFIHLLPEFLQPIVMRIYLFFGIHPNWKNVKNPYLEYIKYLREKLHYRSARRLKNVLNKKGLEMKIVTSEHEMFRKISKSFPFSLFPEAMLAYIISRFYRIHFVAYKL